MNRKMTRNLIILGVVLALAVAFAFVVPNIKKPEPSATPTPAAPEKVVLSDFTTDKVAEVTLQNNVDGLSYTLLKKGGAYVLKGNEGMPLDQTAAGSLFFNVASVNGELVEKDPKDLSIYGLSAPAAVATAKYTDGSTNVFLLGEKTIEGNTYYLMKQGDGRVITVWMNIGNSYLAKSDTLLVKGKFTVTKDDVETVKLLKKDEVVVEMTTLSETKSVSISPWMIMKPWKRSVDSEALGTFLESVFAVSVDSIVEGDAKDLSKYGLDKPKYDLTVSGKGKTDRLLVGADKDKYTTYVMFGDSSTVYTMSKGALAFMDTTAYKLMDKMILLVNIPNATGVEFQGFGQHQRLDIEQKPQVDEKGEKKLDTSGKQIVEQIFTISGKPIYEKAARAWYQTCIGLATHSLVPEGWQPTGEPQAVITYYLSIEPKVIKIEFMAYDEDFYAVRMDGETHFLIKKQNVKTAADDLVKLVAGELVTPEPTAAPATPAPSSAGATPAPTATAAPAPEPGTASPLALIILLVVAAVLAAAIIVGMKRMKKPENQEKK